MRFTNAQEWSAIAPDLYRGKQATEPDDARKAAMELDRAQVRDDLKSVVDWLQKQGVQKVGVVGFCMGGSIAMDLAHEDDRLAAVVTFYGSADLEGRTLKAPLMAHFGGDDGSVPPEKRDAIARQIESSGVEGETFVYEGAGHAFFNDTREAHDPAASELAWDRTLEFFANHFD
jgi:carboxymethylenebutenolidase